MGYNVIVSGITANVTKEADAVLRSQSGTLKVINVPSSAKTGATVSITVQAQNTGSTPGVFVIGAAGTSGVSLAATQSPNTAMNPGDMLNWTVTFTMPAGNAGVAFNLSAADGNV